MNATQHTTDLYIYTYTQQVQTCLSRIRNSRIRKTAETEKWKIRRNWHGGVEPSATRRGEKEDS